MGSAHIVRQPLMSAWHLHYCAVSMLLFINSRLLTPLWKLLSKYWFWGAGWENKKIYRQAEKKDRKRQGYTFSKKEPQRSDKSVRAGSRMKEMKCVVQRGWCTGKRVSLDANSSHLERLMDRGQHFCTYPGSLPPHSITRQSIKSSKNPERHWLKLQGYSAAFCCCTAFISIWCVLFFCRNGLEWNNVKTCLFIS